MLNERRFANAGLARHPHYGPLAVACAVPCPLQAREFRGTADKRRRRRLFELRRLGRGGGRWRKRRRFRNEPIATPRDCFNVSRLARVVRKDAPQVADGGLEHRVAHKAVTPDLVQQRVLAQERTRVADERAQESEGSRRQVDCLPGAPQHRIGLVELELAEAHAQRAGVTASHGCSYPASYVDAPGHESVNRVGPTIIALDSVSGPPWVCLECAVDRLVLALASAVSG